MDPNVALKNARAAAAKLNQQITMDETIDAACELRDSFEALDQWLSTGGFSPWPIGTVATKAEALKPAEAKKPKPKPKKKPSRIDRWNEAAAAAENLVGEIRGSYEELVNKLDELEEVRVEYEEWKDNLPENLQSSALADKLEEVAGLDIDSSKDELENGITTLEDVLSTATGLDLPRGFGRD